jgi:small-conductance mechanosensitive channel
MKMRSRFNNLIIIPNSKMADSIVTNYFSPTPAMNVIVNSGVSYDADLRHVERVVLEVANQLVAESPLAIKDTEPFFGFSSFGDSNIDFFIFLQAIDRTGSFALKSELIKRIHHRFSEEGIEINYPVRKLVPSTPNGQVQVDLVASD